MDDNSVPFRMWRRHGLSTRAANLLCNLHCTTIGELREYGSDTLARQHGIGPATFNEIAKLVDWPSMSVSRVQRQRELRLAKLDLGPPQPANDAQQDLLSEDDLAKIMDMVIGRQ